MFLNCCLCRIVCQHTSCLPAVRGHALHHGEDPCSWYLPRSGVAQRRVPSQHFSPFYNRLYMFEIFMIKTANASVCVCLRFEGSRMIQVMLLKSLLQVNSSLILFQRAATVARNLQFKGAQRVFQKCSLQISLLITTKPPSYRTADLYRPDIMSGNAKNSVRNFCGLSPPPPTLSQVSQRYESSNLLTALPSSFLEPLLSFTLMEDPEIRLLVLSILTSLIDRRHNTARLAAARSHVNRKNRHISFRFLLR